MTEAGKVLATVHLAVAALNKYEAEARDLDVWEAHNLRRAVGAIYTNFFGLAWNEVVQALAPPDERAHGRQDGFASEVTTPGRFRQAFEQARQYVPPEL